MAKLVNRARSRQLLNGAGWIALFCLAVWFALDITAYFTAEALWFENLGYLNVFSTQVLTRASLGLLGFLGTGGAIGSNLWFAHLWRHPPSLQWSPERISRIKLLQLLVVLAGLSLLMAALLTHMGQMALRFWAPQTEIAAAAPQLLTQFKLETLGPILGLWAQTSWLLGLVVGFGLILILAPTWIANGITVGLSLGMGLVISNHWATVLANLHATPFGQTDPLFGHDIGFYIFRLPIWELLRFWWVAVCWTSFITVTVIYLVAGGSLSQGGYPELSPRQQRHLNGLAGALMLSLAWSFWLDRYDLLYSTQGILYGAGYTDARVDLPARTLLSLGGLVIAIWFLLRTCFWEKTKHRLVLPWLLSLYVAIAILLGLVLPRVVQTLIVQPNELVREQPYIARSIQLTRRAFDLDSIETKTFKPTADLTPERLQANDLTIRNIRLWDIRPLLAANRQLQQIRLYYEFPDADVDRYTFKAALPPDQPETTMTAEKQQVLMAARELDYSGVPQEGQTWINQRLIYTHGYGFTLSPVNRAEPSGLPQYFIRNIGTDSGSLETATPEIQASIPTRHPRIYHGELTQAYVLTGTKVKELDYPSGEENVYNTYDGLGGIPLDSPWRRGLFALYLKDWRLLFTHNITPQTQVLFRRQIQQRVRAIAPFLRFDKEPYLVAATVKIQGAESNLHWIIDAYTISDRYPYSDPGKEPFNYIRNSVKVVIDAYNGSVTFYAVDPDDPVLATWRQAFPSLFQPFAAMPANLQSHIRYPVDLFRIQSRTLLTYHMTDPQVFYNREDQWRIPNEIYGTQPQLVQPYYLIMKLPGAESEEFILFSPFTPVRRNNLIAWMAARCDGSHYGKRLLYKFPKRELIFGPEQIEALINQDPAISQRISLWNRQGSRVTQGNLLIIPIEQSLLYVEPLYLEAEETSVPILARVIVVYQDRIVMAETLNQAIDELFRQRQTEVPAIIRPLEDLEVNLPQ